MNTKEEDDEMYWPGVDSLSDDTILPIQFFDGLRRKAHEDDGYRRLIYAILEDTVHTYCYRRVTTAGYVGPTTRARLFHEAETWLFEERYDGPFSCAWICDHLGIEVTVLRKGLRAWDLAGRVPLRMLRRSPTGEHCGAIRLPGRRERRGRPKYLAGGND